MGDFGFEPPTLPLSLNFNPNETSGLTTQIVPQKFIFWPLRESPSDLGSVGPDPEGLLDEGFEELEVGDGLRGGGSRVGQHSPHFLFATWSPRVQNIHKNYRC